MTIETLDEFEQAIYDGFYAGIIILRPPSIREFFDNMSLAETMDGIEGPIVRPNLWLDNIAGQIQGRLLNGGFLSQAIKGQWLIDREDKKWEDIRDELQTTLVRTSPVNFER